MATDPQIDPAVEHDAIVAAFGLIDAGRKDDAQRALSDLAAAGSVRPEAHHALGLLHEDAGDLAAAAAALVVAASLDFSGTGPLRDLVRVYVAQREIGKALGCLSLILKREGPSPELLDVVQGLLAESPANAKSIDWLSPEIEALRARAVAPPPRPVAPPPRPDAPAPTQPAPRRFETDRRIGFLIHAEELLNHYRSVCRQLRSGTFVFLIHAAGDEASAIARAVECEGWPSLQVADTLARGLRFRAMVSNHPLAVGDTPLIKQLAETNVRFMYAAGKLGWNLQDWNRLYDLILCFGPRHAELFATVSAAPVIQMGYPRFDPFFDGSIDCARALAAFGCDPSRQTVVWLPTWSTLSSVDAFGESIARLTARYNVVVKVHPLMQATEPARVDRLEALGFTCLIRDATDNLPLYRIADFMLFDYGGPAFGAIYTDRNLLLLDLPGARDDALLGRDATEFDLRESLPSIGPDQASRLPELLGDPTVWERQAPARAALRRRYFAPYYGFAAKMAATALENLDAITGREAPHAAW